MSDDAKVRVGYCREMARRVLQRNNIVAPPVDVEAILRNEGYTVVRRPWEDRVSGIALKAQRLVGVNSNHHPVRQRFSLAHECGHLVLGHRDDEPLESFSTIDDEPREISYTVVEEKEANAFAGELLVPLSFLKNSRSKCKDPDQLAAIYQVSRDVMFIQLQNHHLLF